MRIVFAGTPQVAVPSLQALLASEIEVVAVLTRPDAPQKRSRRLQASAVKEAALAAGLPVLSPRSARDPDLIATLQGLNLAGAAVVAYGNLLPPAILATAGLGWVNLHFSLLPAWRGAAPVPAAIAAGDDLTGATTFVLDEGMDTGAVVGVLTEPVRARDTAGDLLARLAAAGAPLLVDSLRALRDGTARPQPQVGPASYAPKITVAAAQLDFTAPARVLDRLIRAHTPNPGAWTMLNGNRLGIGPALAVDIPGSPGRITVHKNQVLVGTGTGSLELTWVKPAGKRAMAAGDWARGNRVDSLVCESRAQ